MTVWGALLKVPSRYASYEPPGGWWNDERRLHLTSVTCTASAGAKASPRNRNMAELLAEMPLCELQVADPGFGKEKAATSYPRDRPFAEPEELFQTVCLLGKGRTSCQPNLICGPGSMFQVVWSDDNEKPGHDYKVHVVGHELTIKKRDRTDKTVTRLADPRRNILLG
ncbi:hypothetical protein KFL_001830235 [Klebsormidium nitens]|uniref:Uncharacterized protein n=1 Tax=Klebsormidium nitens TaxID=105231 RepID=A0A1Y1I6F1_KLENI|nr:hypothetical protein KFL_001830235 [Klebsormidium nitens]|eukprot:GAQ84297.1 hypothetical protein KFL_001830235 [Klebsormidium nitens]